MKRCARCGHFFDQEQCPICTDALFADPATERFGPAFDAKLDGKSLAKQHERIRDYMLGLHPTDRWRTLREIAAALNYPEASVSAQLRHLRKPKFGSYDVEKRRRVPARGVGLFDSMSSRLWEYRLSINTQTKEGL